VLIKRFHQLGEVQERTAEPIEGMDQNGVKLALADVGQEALQARAVRHVCNWGGEFGRIVYSRGTLTKDYSRDHHGRCF
jgi:hypothetical protein